MKSFRVIALFLLTGACSDSSFKGGVAAGEAPAPSSVDSNTPSGTSEPTGNTAIDQLTAECAKAAGSLKVLEQSISYPERKNCNWGVAPNLAIRNNWIQASETSTQKLNLPAGKICDIAIESPKEALLHYDDILVLSIEDKAIFVSSEHLLPFLEKKDGIYLWDFAKVVGQKPKDFGGKSYCIGEATDCVIPDTDKTGPVAISLSNSKIAPIAVAIAGKSSVAMNLTATGDDDDEDCAHTQLDVKVTFKYLP